MDGTMDGWMGGCSGYPMQYMHESLLAMLFTC